MKSIEELKEQVVAMDGLHPDLLIALEELGLLRDWANVSDPPMPNMLEHEKPEEYYARLTGSDRTGRSPYPGRSQACAIREHDMCSDRLNEAAGEEHWIECDCPCHEAEAELIKVRAFQAEAAR